MNQEDTILGVFLIFLLIGGWIVGLWLSHIEVEQPVKQQNQDNRYKGVRSQESGVTPLAEN